MPEAATAGITRAMLDDLPREIGGKSPGGKRLDRTK
jgi:hypothetical protein